MENTRGERTSRTRNTGYSRTTRGHSSRDKNENSYKKAIIMLQLMICLGLFTGVLIIRTINNSFTEDIRNKIKATLSQNISISNIYNKASDKIKEVISLKTENIEVKTEEETKKKQQTSTEKLVPMLED